MLDPDVAAKQPMGLRPVLDLDKAMKLSAALEGEKIVRKLEVHK